ncbi:MAG: cytochrome P450 [Alphaproteobacteria bacterium]|nr:cytochrome P450 [Alphaproteobacteria bacterium]MCB9929476.1 cytochrome P450 [Alphaproteobacteria bacterium]
MVAPLDLSNGQTFKNGFPHDFFADLRAHRPIYWHEPTEHTPGKEGFWVVSRYDDIERVFRHPDLFSSEKGPGRSFGGTTLLDDPAAGKMMIQMDNPKHARLRAIVTSGFTPATLARLEQDVQRLTGEILDGVAEGEPFDFVETVARELPLQVICEIVGVPRADRFQLIDWLDKGISQPSEGVIATEYYRKVRDYGRALVQEKRRAPSDDILSIITHARLEDHPDGGLTDRELELFFVLLFSAGSETTRSAIGGAMLAFLQNPDQLQKLRDEPGLMRWALEEIVRWTTPSIYKRRTTTAEVEIAGQRIAPNQKVTVWEMSANRDERKFDNPFAFDIARKPNRHIGFGAGVHFCLGANLARMEIRCMLGELLRRYRGFELAGEPEWTPSNRLLGLKRLPVSLAAA